MRPLKGRITTERTVWCCGARRGDMPFRPVLSPQHLGCDSYYQTAVPKAGKQARVMGWVSTAEFGWLCPPCAEGWRRWKKTRRVL